MGSVVSSRAISWIEYSSTFFFPIPRNPSSVRVLWLTLITRSSVSFMSVAMKAQSCTEPPCISAESTAGWSFDGMSRK